MNQITEPILPKGKWRLIWGDEFDGAKLNESKWRRAGPYKAFGGWIVPEAVSLDGRGVSRHQSFSKERGVLRRDGSEQGQVQAQIWILGCSMQTAEGAGAFPCLLDLVVRAYSGLAEVQGVRF